jgi:hypothetical protein
MKKTKKLIVLSAVVMSVLANGCAGSHTAPMLFGLDDGSEGTMTSPSGEIVVVYKDFRGRSYYYEYGQKHYISVSP